jgi:hypothetical protein
MMAGYRPITPGRGVMYSCVFADLKCARSPRLRARAVVAGRREICSVADDFDPTAFAGHRAEALSRLIACLILPAGSLPIRGFVRSGAALRRLSADRPL